MGSIARILHTRNDSRFRNAGLQKGQFVFLTRLCENAGTTVVGLAKLARVDQTTATKAVSKLETAGYLSRLPDPKDGRSHTLWPSAKALEQYQKIVQAENDDLNQGLAGFTEADKQGLLSLLERIRSNLEGAQA